MSCEWMSLRELARVMGKSYDSVAKLVQTGALASRDLRFYRTSPRGRIYVCVDQDLLDRLSVSLEEVSLHPS